MSRIMSGQKEKDANYINNVLTSLRRSLFLALLAQKFWAFEGLLISFGYIRFGYTIRIPSKTFSRKTLCTLWVLILERAFGWTLNGWACRWRSLFVTFRQQQQPTCSLKHYFDILFDGFCNTQCNANDMWCLHEFKVKESAAKAYESSNYIILLEETN